MKIALLALLAATGLQTTQAETPATLSPSEKAEITAKASAALHDAVQFDTQGSASSHFVRRNHTTKVEWRNLVFRQLILGTVSKKDRQQGVSRRVYAQLGSDAYRLLKTDSIGPWRSGHCPGFPGFIMAEEINGTFVISAPDLANFHKSPELVPAQPARPKAGDERAIAKQL